MDLKLEYQTFRAKPSESLLHTYTCYKTLLNELANDGVNLSKHEINVGFVNSLPEKWLPFSEGPRNANHTQTLDLADIYGSTSISTAFFSNNVIQDFQENFDDESSSSQADPKIQKDYKAEYKKMKAKLTLLEASPSTSQTPKTFQLKNISLVAKTFDWDKEGVSDDEEVIEVKVLMALADDELTIGNNHAQNGEWIDITIRKVNILFSMDEDADWKNYLKYINIDLKFVEEQRLNLLSKYNKIVNQCIGEKIPHQKKKVLGGELYTESSSKMKDSKAESLTPLPPLKILYGASPSLEVMSLTFQPHSPKEIPSLGIMKHAKPETEDSLNKSVLGTVAVSKTEQTTPSVPT
ncbi:hypothetical protein Tco_0324998 [Tanacetum coccineum]